MPFVANSTELEDVLKDKYEGANDHTFALYDIFAKIAACTFLLSVVLIGFACRNRHVTKVMEPIAARGSFRRGIIALIVFVFAYMVSKRQCADMKNIIDEIAAEKNATIEVAGARRELSFYNHHRHKKQEDPFDQLEQYVDSIFKSHESKRPEGFEEGMDARDYVDMMDEMDQMQEDEASMLSKFFTRERIYKMFAPKLWKFAKHQGNETSNPKQPDSDIMEQEANGTCPVILALLISILANLYMLKSLEKQLANLQLYNLTKELL